ncbi:MAG: class I SAM-dependent methyltransferase [Akkermansiaceae bacterium]
MDEQSYGEIRSKLDTNDWYFRNHDYRFRLTIAEVAQGRSEPGRILDIGCWPGYLAMYFRAQNWEVDAIDLRPDRIPLVAEAGVSLHSHNINDSPQFPFEAESFDCILFTEVFEHLDPAGFPVLFKDLERILKPGGRVILSTPNRFSLNKDLFNPFRWNEPEVDEDGHGHWKEYRLSEVLEFFAPTDLQVVKKETIAYYAGLGRSNEIGYFPLAEWRSKPNQLRNFAKVLLQPVRKIPVFRDSLLVIAEKPDF